MNLLGSNDIKDNGAKLLSQHLNELHKLAYLKLCIKNIINI